MDWTQDMTARWLRILGAAGERGTPLEEAARQISGIEETASSRGRFGRSKRSAPDQDAASMVTALSRQLIAGVSVNDLLMDRLTAATGQTREQVLDELAGGSPRQLRDQQVRALQIELSGSCQLLREQQRASYAGLGDRVEQLLRLAGTTGLGADRRGPRRGGSHYGNGR